MYIIIDYRKIVLNIRSQSSNDALSDEENIGTNPTLAQI